MLLDVFFLRRSDREYLDKPVERDKIEVCLEAARLAPSACNSQPWRFVVIDDPQMRDRVAVALYDAIMKENRFALEAPVEVAVVAEKPKAVARLGGFLKNKPFSCIDIGIAAEHFFLRVAAEGLGTCAIGWFNERKVQKNCSVFPVAGEFL